MKLISNICGTFGKLSGKAAAKSPIIFLAAGTVCLAGAVILSHEAGRKVEETLDVNKEAIDNIKALKGSESITDENGEVVPYSEKEYKRDLTKAYFGAVGDVAKLYLPPIACTAAAVTCYVSGHKILAKRLACMSAAYTAVSKSFDSYRNRVKLELGEDADKHFIYGTETVPKASVSKYDAETQEIIDAEVKKWDCVRDVKLVASPYAVSFEDCKGFTRDPNYNVLYLEAIQHQANLKLQQKGYLFLSEMYELLGVSDWINTEAVKASQVVGWLAGEGDCEVICDLVYVPEKSMIKDGEVVHLRETCLVDFNCVGTIIDKI